MQDPFIYRLVEAVQHYGMSIKNVVNDLKGDGIISAIDIYADAKIIKGFSGEDRGRHFIDFLYKCLFLMYWFIFSWA